MGLTLQQTLEGYTGEIDNIFLPQPVCVHNAVLRVERPRANLQTTFDERSMQRGWGFQSSVRPCRVVSRVLLQSSVPHLLSIQLGLTLLDSASAFLSCSQLLVLNSTARQTMSRQTPWIHKASSLPSDRIPSRNASPKQKANPSAVSGKQQASGGGTTPKSKEVRRLEMVVKGLRAWISSGQPPSGDPKGGCFCQGAYLSHINVFACSFRA
jgi:hypothetical protein